MVESKSEYSCRWWAHATPKDFHFEFGQQQCRASRRSSSYRRYSNGFALCGDGSRVLLVKIDNESSLCLIDGIGTGG